METKAQVPWTKEQIDQKVRELTAEQAHVSLEEVTLDTSPVADLNFDSLMEIELVIADENADEAVKAIIQAARTGEIGDGRVFVLPVGQSYRIRTGELAV